MRARAHRLLDDGIVGHERGAFTGALQRRTGRFELANNGTLFLDEMGELPIDLQVKLLRVLQEQEFERVGGSQTIRADVRLVVAMSRDLELSGGRIDGPRGAAKILGLKPSTLRSRMEKLGLL